MSNVGSRIRAARTAKNLTQGELGRKAGIEQARLSRIERGAAIPSIEEVEKLARGMRVSVASLVDDPSTGADPMSPALQALVAKGALPPGLEELAKSGGLVESLGITDREFQTLASIDLPGETDRDGYVQLLLTVRAIRMR